MDKPTNIKEYRLKKQGPEPKEPPIEPFDHSDPWEMRAPVPHKAAKWIFGAMMVIIVVAILYNP